MSSAVPPATMHTRRPGIREVSLLLIAAGFALLMLDLGNLAIVAGWSVVALWTYAMVAGPRPTAVVTLVYGGGLFVTTFWWPREGWWLAAISLMWAGIGLMLVALLSMAWSRWRSGSGNQAYNP